MQPGDSVLVVGLGPTGLTQVQILNDMKAGNIIGSDIVKVRREMATRLGCHTVLDPHEQEIPAEVRKFNAQRIADMISARLNIPPEARPADHENFLELMVREFRSRAQYH